MATIQNSIVLNDRMTQTFTAINNAISATVNSLSSLDGKSMNINTANLSTTRQQLALAENELQKMKGDSKGLNDNLSKTPGIVDAIQKKMIQAGTAIAGVMGAKQLLQASDQNAQITARLNLITDAPEQLKEQIYQSANDARVAYTDSMNQVAKLGLLAKDAFNNTDEIVQFTNLMQKAFKVSGADAVEATSAMYQLTQAMAAGKLQGDEFRSVMENAPMVAQAIAKHMNVSVGELKKLGAEVKEVSLPYTKYAISTYYIISSAEAASNLSRYDGVRYGVRKSDENIEEMYVKSRTEGFGDEVKRRIMIGNYVLSSGFYDAYYKKASQVRRLIRDDFLRVLSEVDLILTPVSPTTAFKKGEKVTDPVQMYLGDIFTVSINMAGLPAISVPAGFVNGLPVGIQLIGNYFREDLLFNVANKFEKERGEIEYPEL